MYTRMRGLPDDAMLSLRRRDLCVAVQFQGE